MADKKNTKLPIIKTRAQLKMIIDGLESQGFGYYVGDWKAHDYKVNSIIRKNNTLGIKEDTFMGELTKEVEKLTNYSEIEKIVKNFLKKFKPDDKINELLNNFYLKPETVVRQPSSSHPGRKEIIEWVKFKRKYGIKGEPNFNWNVSVYNLDKNFVKISFFGEHYEKKPKFTNLYELIYGEEPNEWSAKMGGWQDLGKIEVKIFQNGSMNIKGDIKELKKRLYDNINRHDCVIFYNKKKEIFERRSDD